MFAHLAPILREDVAQAQHVAIRGLVKHQGSDSHHGVKPATGLIDGLTDEVTRVVRLEFLLRAWHMRVSPLRKGHRTRIEPSISHLGYPVIGMAIPSERHLVNEWTVRIHSGEITPSVLGQFGQRLHTDDVGAVVVVAP